MEADAGSKLECPLLVVGIVDLPFGSQPGNDDARLVGGGKVPHRQRVEHGQAGEAVAFKTLIGLAQRTRNVGSGHADAQNRFRAGDPRQRCHRRYRQHRKHCPACSRFFTPHRCKPLLYFRWLIPMQPHATAVPITSAVRRIVIDTTTLCQVALTNDADA